MDSKSLKLLLLRASRIVVPFLIASFFLFVSFCSILGTQVDPDICAFYDSIAPVCCPNNGGGDEKEAAKCEFCPSGMDDPYTVLPSSDGSSCQDIKR
mmetsp:Transcript_18158/g.44920  ORF Transcript_18158/g.44920 Transcript_18158/m.44920 type:complete len:97 (-) Transcript_18158:3518-3808(-)